ncbi:MAG: LuxR C-terminal-related transcriptional regulator, partial [Thermomicrobiales bacterium]
VRRAPRAAPGGTLPTAQRTLKRQRRLAMAFPAELPPLPVPLTRFIGRESETAAVAARVCTAEARLLTLVGPGGVGKTRLALHTAARVQDDIPAGVAFVPLGAILDPALVLPAIAHALGIEGEATREPADWLRRALPGWAGLLVLDTFEHVTAASAALGDLLTTCPALCVLVTSRVPLRISGEHVFPVAPFATPVAAGDTDADLAALAATDAAALFLDRARAAHPAFALTPGNARDVAEICRRSDGLPLAIELAAARLRVLAPAELAARLERPLPLLAGGPHDRPDRLRAMRSAIAWSYDLLDARQQRLFRWLAVFSGDFGVPAVEAMAAAIPGAGAVFAVDLLGELADACLVQRVESPAEVARFAMLETIREFGLEQLAATGEDTAAREAQAAWCLAFAEVAGPHLAGPEHLAWWNRLNAELPTIRQAYAWFVARHDAEQALRLGVALAWFWSVAGYYREGRGLNRALAAMPGAEGSPALFAQVLGAAANLEHWLDELDAAEALYHRQIALSKALGDGALQVSALRALGSIAVDRGDYAAARTVLAEGRALAVAVEVGAAWDAAAIANLSGLVAFADGEYAAAARWGEEAVRGWQAMDDTGHAAAAQVNLARASMAAGELGSAAALLGEVLDLVQAEVGDDMITSDCWDVAAGLALAGGDARRCVQLLGAAEAMLGRMSVVRRMPVQTHAVRLQANARRRLGERQAALAAKAGAGLTVEAALALARAVVDATARASETPGEAGGFAALTAREQDVLRLVASGQSDKEIAAALGITRFTASNHVSNIRAKLGAPSRTAVAALALREGLL